MNYKIIGILMLVLSVLLVAGCLQGNGAVAGQATAGTGTTCTDSDGGQNFKVLGTVTVTSGTRISKLTDNCYTTGSRTYLTEYYCRGTTSTNSIKLCSDYGANYICQNGACVDTTPPITCTDSDNGANFLTAGKVTSSLYPQGKDDYCQTMSGKQYVFEGICRNNAYSAVQKNCAEVAAKYVCDSGKCRACKPWPVTQTKTCNGNILTNITTNECGSPFSPYVQDCSTLTVSPKAVYLF